MDLNPGSVRGAQGVAGSRLGRRASSASRRAARGDRRLPGEKRRGPTEASVGPGKKLGIQGGGELRELPDGQDVVCLSQATAVTS